MDNYEDIKKRLDELQKAIIQKQYKQYEKTIKIFSEYYKIYKKHNNILIKFGWPPFARTYTDDMRNIINISEKNNDYEQTKKEINQYFIKRLQKENFQYLDYLLASWSEVGELKRRISILNNIIFAHKSGCYSLSIPVIIIQIEGIIAECNNHKGIITYKKNKEYFQELFSLNGKVPSDEPANDFISSKLYESFEWGDSKRHEISRHAIIHGEDVHYATETNAIKMIYLLDYVIYIAFILGKE